MPSIFDGVAGILNDMFGASVTITPAAGVPVNVQAIFREEPVVIGGGEGGDVLGVMPTLKVQSAGAAGLATGDTVDPGNGKIYRIVNSSVSGSPAADRFIIFELEETTA